MSDLDLPHVAIAVRPPRVSAVTLTGLGLVLARTGTPPELEGIVLKAAVALFEVARIDGVIVRSMVAAVAQIPALARLAPLVVAIVAAVPKIIVAGINVARIEVHHVLQSRRFDGLTITRVACNCGQ